MWELDHKEGWVSKNWCFQIVVLEKTLESPLDSKEIKPVNPKGNQPWILFGQTTNLENIQATPTAQLQKNKWPNQKMGQRTNRHFSKEDIQMANMHMKRYSILLIIREIQIKTSLRNHRPVKIVIIQFSSVTQSCLTLCDPIDCSTPVFPVHHQPLNHAQTHVHWVGDAIQPSHPLSSPSPPTFNLSQHQGLLQWIHSSHQVAKGLEFQLQHQSFQWIFRNDFL